MKKIAISANKKDLTSMIAGGIGRSNYMCIVEWDEANNKIANYHFIKNDQPLGRAGVDLARDSVNEGIEAVITQYMGPQVFGLLQNNGVGVYETPRASIEDCAIQYFSNNLTPMNSPNSPTGGNTGQGQGRGAGQGLGRGIGQGQGQGYGRGQGQGQGTGRGRGGQGRGLGPGQGRGRNRRP